jgi:hypothetical protein
VKALSAIVLMIVVLGCNADKKREAAPAPARVESAYESVVTASNPAPPLFERHAAPEPELGPAQVPVEEDFVAEAEQRIGKSAKLEVELERLRKEIQSESQ